MMKRLLFALATLALGASLAASDQAGHNWQVKYPAGFVYAWINVDNLVFDLTDDTAQGAGSGYKFVNGVLDGKKGYVLANYTNFLNCLGLSSGGTPASTTLDVSTSSGSVACKFAPEIDVDLSTTDTNTSNAYDYGVRSYGGNSTQGDLQAVDNGSASTAVADATLLFALWPLNTWKVTVSQSAPIGGAKLDLYLGGYWNGSDVVDRGGNSVSPVDPSTSPSIDQTSSNFWYLSGLPFYRAVPMLFGLTIDGTSDTSGSAVVTYTVTSP